MACPAEAGVQTIVTKEHGGQIKVETKEGDGAEFIIELPAI